MEQNFRGGMSDEQISNLAHQTIHNVANLRDNLLKWAEGSGREPQRVWDAFNASFPLRVIQDLSNNDKHGYPPKNGVGNSGRAPKLVDITRSMLFGAEPGKCVALIFGPGGPHRVGEGSAKVIVTGRVIDKDGGWVGDLEDLCRNAVAAWEALLTAYGVTVR